MAKRCEQFLCIGDEILLHDENGNILVTENPLDTRACARAPFGPDHTLSSESMGSRIFRVEPQQSYSARRALEQFQSNGDDGTNLYSAEELAELSALEASAAKEQAQNMTEKRRLLGKPVLYGDVIQLYSRHMRKYLTVTGQTCKSDVSHLQVNLSDDIIGYFKIIPRYRIRVDGEPVRLGDTVAIQCLHPEGFLNVSTRAHHSDVYNTDYYEVYTHTRIASWTMTCHCSAMDAVKSKYIKSGQYVRVYHKEMEGYLESPVLSRDRNDIRLKKHVINPLDPKESDSPLAFWEIENADTSKGANVRWKHPVRIRHAASRAYLYIDPSNVSIDMTTHKVSFSFGLVKNPQNLDNNDATLFTLIPVSEPSYSGVPFGSYVRVQHVLTKCWMHAATDNEVPTSVTVPSLALTVDPSPLDKEATVPQLSVRNSVNVLSEHYDAVNGGTIYPMQQPRADSHIYRITASQEFYYHDCFTITLVSGHLENTFNRVNELLPQLQWFLCKPRPVSSKNDNKIKFPITRAEFDSITDILKALIEFCTVSKEFDPEKRVGLPDEYHQALLRDIGIIEAVIHMIQIPFDLAKRFEVRHNLCQSERNKQDRQNEEAVTMDDLQSGENTMILKIISLCYSLLRVFLVGGSAFEESGELVKNQNHVVQIAGDTGMELFMRHLICGVGATEMMFQLLQNNHDTMQSVIAIHPNGIHGLINQVRRNAKLTLHHMIVEKERIERKQDHESASGLDLLSAFCQLQRADQHDFISKHFFSSPADYVLQMRDDHSKDHVEIALFSDDVWYDIYDLVQDGESSATFKVLKGALGLLCSLSMGANGTLLGKIRPCISKDICLKCLGDLSLPCLIRATFCDLLRVLYVQVPPYVPVLLSDFTLQYDTFHGSDRYPTSGIGNGEPLQPEFFDSLKQWTLLFLDDKRNQFTMLYDEVDFLSSVLRLTYAQLQLGFFIENEDVKRLFRALVHVLDGRTDARNEIHLKFLEKNNLQWTERFKLNEETLRVMNTKIQILEIFDLIYDLRLHVRMNKLAYKWKSMETKSDKKAHQSLGTALTAIFQETMLRQRENSLMPILKDILKYQYAPLKRVAVIVMHRIYNDCEELFNKAQQVLIISQPQQVFVYHGIKKRLTRLRSFLEAGRLSADHLPRINGIVREFIALLNDNKTIDFDNTIIPLTDGSNQRNIYCKLFKNLNVHSTMIHLLVSLKNLSPPYLPPNGTYMDDTQLQMETMAIMAMKTCLEFLDELTKDDRELQGQFILEHIGLLTEVIGCDRSLALALKKICGNNLHVSMRIHEDHIRHILELSKGYRGEYLSLLHGFTKAQGKLIKKHQDCVMRLIVDNRTLYVPFESPEDWLASDHVDYCTELIRLLAVCGQGDNTFGQSFARTIFSIQDIATLICNENAPWHLKTVIFQFLASIYLDNTEVPTSVPVSDDDSIRDLMEVAFHALLEATNGGNLEFLSYVYDGVLVFLRSMFEYHLSIETTVDEVLYILCPKLVDLAADLLEVTEEGDTHRLQHVLGCLDSMINVAGFRGSTDPEVIRERLRKAMEMATDKTNNTLRPLDAVNAKFQGFIRALTANKDIKRLMEDEFSKLGSHFNLSKPKSEEDVKSLIDYLSMMTGFKGSDQRETYQVATIKLLQQIPLQYIQERSTITHLEDPVRFEMLEKKKTQAQNTLNKLGCTLVAQNLLSSPRRHIFNAALKLLIALLEGGNKNVQDKLEEYFYSIREERFFYSFHNRLYNGIISLKEAQQHLLRATYKMKRQQFILSVASPDNAQAVHKTKRHIRRRPMSIDLSRNNMHKRMFAQSGEPQINASLSNLKISNLMASEMAELGATSEDFQGMRDTMRALQLMVEGHNINLQKYLAKQPDNIKSFNIVQDVVEYLHAIVPICNIQNVRLIIQVLDTITELAQGCVENQMTIFNDKIVNPANTILREKYPNCPSSLINELKSKVVICLLSLLEGGIDNSQTIFREMAASLDLSVVLQNMTVVYENNVKNLNSPGTYEKLNCGFQYCMLIMTLWPAFDETQQAMFDGDVAFEFFQSNTGKVEVVMDYNQEKQLSRVLFPIPEVCKYLREDTKQRFLWNVKRDSPSTKIEDFVKQSSNIIYEIENHAKIARNQYLLLLTTYSTLWSRAAYFVTILLNMLMLYCSSMLIDNGSEHSGGYCNRFMSLAAVVLGIAHLILWTLSTAEFYVTQLPVLVNRHHANHSLLRNQWTNPTLHQIKSHTGNFDIEFLLASLLERSFLYHIVMVVLSLCGLYYPGFYALHLLDFAFRDRIVQGVIASITLNVSSISRTALLGIIVVYIHSIVAYVYFRTEFDLSQGMHCNTLSQCFVTVLSHGVRSGGGIGDILEPDTLEEPRNWRTAFEMSFFLLVVVFLLNAIFGIIFDTFGHLRDERSAVQNDMKNSCFICSIPAVEFQRQAKKGFDDHVKNDHNIWQYLFFLVHLKNKDRTEYTGPESYVAEGLKEANYGFFPINRALCLHLNEKDDAERLEKLEEITYRLSQKLTVIEERLEKMAESQTRSRSNSVLLSPV